MFLHKDLKTETIADFLSCVASAETSRLIVMFESLSAEDRDELAWAAEVSLSLDALLERFEKAIEDRSASLTFREAEAQKVRAVCLRITARLDE